MTIMTSSKRLQVVPAICLVISLTSCADLGIHDTESLFFPGLRRSEVVGFIAGLGTTFAALPDVIAMIKRRSCIGMNPRMAAIMGSFQIVWVYYGLLIGSRPVILWNIIAVGTNFFSVAAYYYFRSRERGDA
jgi:uncharacterized protein with PQ loop repeat